jgi:hypothetical protein
VGWLTGYSYRKGINITGQGSGYSDVQAKLIVRYNSSYDVDNIVIGCAKDYTNNPLFNPASGAPKWIAAAYDSGTYYVFLGSPTSDPSDIDLWTSTDGINFSDQGTVISRGANGTWDDYTLEPHSIIYINGEYRLYYGGYDGSTWKVGYAYASNLAGAWTKYASNPVISPSGGETYCADPHAVLHEGTVYMFYADSTGTQWNIHLATSNDGITFTKYGSNPVRLNKIPAAYLSYDGGILCFEQPGSGTARPIYMHWTTDGINCTNYANNPIMNLGVSGDFDDAFVGHLDIVKIDNTLTMFYDGRTGAATWQVGRAFLLESIYLGNNCKTDFGDIRFTSSDGSTELNYWLKSKVDSDFAEFQVELDTVPASGNTGRIYIYYGNADASTTSSMKNTSLSNQGDDFNDNSRDTGIWDLVSYGTGVASETSNHLQLYCPSSTDVAGYVSVNYHAVSNLLLKVQINDSNISGVESYLALTKTTNSYPGSENDFYKMLMNKSNSNYYVQKRKAGGSVTTLYNDGWSANPEDIIVVVSSGKIYFYEGNLSTLRYSETWDLSSSNCYIYLCARGSTYTGTDWEDNFWIQKLINREDFDNVIVWGEFCGTQTSEIRITHYYLMANSIGV